MDTKKLYKLLYLANRSCNCKLPCTQLCPTCRARILISRINVILDQFPDNDLLPFDSRVEIISGDISEIDPQELSESIQEVLDSCYNQYAEMWIYDRKGILQKIKVKISL